MRLNHSLKLTMANRTVNEERMKSGGPEGLGRGSWFNLEQAPSFFGVGPWETGAWYAGLMLDGAVGRVSLSVTWRDFGFGERPRPLDWNSVGLLFPRSRAGPESFGVKVKMSYRLDTFDRFFSGHESASTDDGR